MDSSRLLTVCAVLLSAAACAHKQPQPVMVSSAYGDGYALGYPMRLSAETDALAGDKQRTTEVVQKLGTRSGELKPGADPTLVLIIVQQADETGRSEAFATANDEARGLHAFWDEERGRITGRVSSATQKQLTEANCSQTDLSGTIGYALKDGVDKQLEKRLRTHNEAQRTIERNKTALGAANVATLQKLADDIALTSYLVNIALVLERNRIDRLLAERSDVEDTLNDAIVRERAFGASARGAADKKASQERMVELDKSRAMLQPAAANAEAARKDLDPLIDKARKDYQAALDALENDLKAQAARAKH